MNGSIRPRRAGWWLAMGAAALAACAGRGAPTAPPRPASVESAAAPAIRVATSKGPGPTVEPAPQPRPDDRFLHRFEVIAGPDRGEGRFEVAALPAAGDGGVIALVSYDGALALGDRRIRGGPRSSAVIKLDAAGQLVWAHALEGREETDGARQSPDALVLAVAPDGDVIVGGGFRGSGDGFSLLRLSPFGMRLWQVAPTRGRERSEVRGLAVDARGDVVVVGQFSSRLTIPGLPAVRCGGACGFVASFDGATGAPRWADAVRSGEGALVGVAAADDDVVVAGHFGPAAVLGEEFRLRSRGELDLVVARYGPGGELRWAVRHGGPGRDELLAMVALTDRRLALQSEATVIAVSEDDGAEVYQQPLGPDQTLVASSRPRSRPWIATRTEQADGTTSLVFDALEPAAAAARVGELRTSQFRLPGAITAVVGQSTMLLGGAIVDNRWDASPPSPFVLSVPLAVAAGGEALEQLPSQGRTGSSRCEGEPGEQPGPLELRTGFALVRGDVIRCGVEPRALRFSVTIDGQGRVGHAEVTTPLSMSAESCVTAALGRARFCPFDGESYTVELMLP